MKINPFYFYRFAFLVFLSILFLPFQAMTQESNSATTNSPTIETPKVETPNIEVPKVETPGIGISSQEGPKNSPPSTDPQEENSKEKASGSETQTQTKPIETEEKPKDSATKEEKPTETKKPTEKKPAPETKTQTKPTETKEKPKDSATKEEKPAETKKPTEKKAPPEAKIEETTKEETTKQEAVKTDSSPPPSEKESSPQPPSQTTSELKDQKPEPEKKEKTSLEYEPQEIEVDIITERPQPKRVKKRRRKSLVVSTRSKKIRTPFNSPVPVDFIRGSKLIQFGNTADLIDPLNVLIPSYMAAPAVAGGSAFVRPTTLRGMSSDQMLVLVNGKRRHRSSHIHQSSHYANRGSQGVDISMIPTIALKNVEVLRGGASAQYGSDALAGVINFNLKDRPRGGSVQATYGQFFDGEKNWRVGANLGISFLNKRGFANIAFDTNEVDGHSRGFQDKRASELIQGSNRNLNVGSDAVFGDAPLVNSWGRPQSGGARVALNSGLSLSAGINLYFFGNYAQTNGRSRLLYRDPDHPALVGNSQATNLERAKKRGFTPFLEGDQEDMNLVFGLRGELFKNTIYDLSTTTAFNTLDYKLNNSLNRDAELYYGSASRVFNPGGYRQAEQNYNADFSTSFNDKNTHVSYGLEFREETFTQYSGEIASYVGVGSAGMTGQDTDGQFSRTNYGVYADVEHRFATSPLHLQYSLRYDNFSDFGDTINNKISGIFKLLPKFSPRASFGTSFRAPTPGQSNFTYTSTTFVDGYEVSRFHTTPANSEELKDLGINSLSEEKATDVSMGFVSKISKKNYLTLDAYIVTIKDRIHQTLIDRGETKNKISTYANSLDTRHQGVDLVWNSKFRRPISFVDKMYLRFAYNYNNVSVTDNKFIRVHQSLNKAQVEDFENSFPKHNLVIMMNTRMKKWGLMTRARYIGEHYDEIGRISLTKEEFEEAEDSEDNIGLSKLIDPVIYFDLELSYRPIKNFAVIIGGANIFDKYPSETMPSGANLRGYGMPYPRYTMANYEGGSWYLRAVYNF